MFVQQHVQHVQHVMNIGISEYGDAGISVYWDIGMRDVGCGLRWRLGSKWVGEVVLSRFVDSKRSGSQPRICSSVRNMPRV